MRYVKITCKIALAILTLALLAGCREPGVLLIKIEGYDTVADEAVVIYYADAGFTATDGTHVQPRIRGEWSVDTSLFANRTSGGASEVGAGAVTLINTDGALNAWFADIIVTGYPVTMLHLPDADTPLASATVLFKGTCDAPTFNGDDTVTLPLRDRTAEFDAEFQPYTYDGSYNPSATPMGDGGTADLKGKRKPLARGVVRNIPLTCINPALQIYQGGEKFQEVLGVFDGGAEVGVDKIKNGTFEDETAWIFGGQIGYDAVNKRAKLLYLEGCVPTKNLYQRFVLTPGASYSLELKYYLISASPLDVEVWIASDAGGYLEKIHEDGYGYMYTVDKSSGVTVTFTAPAGSDDGSTYLDIVIQAGGSAAVNGWVDEAHIYTIITNHSALMDLEAATVPAGGYHTCNALGLIRFGIKPTREYTADVIGRVTDLDPIYGYSMAELLRSTAIRMGFQSVDLDSDAFAALYAAYPAPCGLFAPEGGQAKGYMDCIAAAGGWWTFTPAGVLTVGRFLDPAGLTADAELDLTVHGQGVQLVPSNDDNEGSPVYRVEVKYQRVYAVQESTINAGQMVSDSVVQAATAERAALVGEEWRTAVAEDLTIRAKWPRARVLTVETALDDVDDAEAEAARLLDLHKVVRVCVEATVPMDVVDGLKLGDVVLVTYHKWGMTAGVKMAVIGWKPTYGGGLAPRVKLVLWG